MAKIQRMSLQYEIISYIKNYIQEHNLKAGERLPSQAEMLEMMGVSRTALREAIKTLEAKDVLEVKNGKGVYVKENFKEALYNQVDIVSKTVLAFLKRAGIACSDVRGTSYPGKRDAQVGRTEQYAGRIR